MRGLSDLNGQCSRRNSFTRNYGKQISDNAGKNNVQSKKMQFS